MGEIGRVTLSSKAQPIGTLYAENNTQSAPQPAASVMPFGKGKLAATWFAFSRGYLTTGSPEMRSFLNDLTHQLFPTPVVEVDGSPNVDVSLAQLNGALAVNLVNTSGPHWKEPLIDSIPPIGPFKLTIRTAKPNSVTLEPGAHSLPFDFRDGKVQVTAPSLEIHSVIVIK